MYTATYDNFKYKTNDRAFFDSINAGQSEPYPGGELDAIKSYLKANPNKNRTYVDIGSHIGTTVMPMSRLYQTVYGFEPNPPTYELLHSNIELNHVNNITIFNFGLSNKDTTGTIKLHGQNSGCFYIDSTGSGDIMLTTLDSLDLKDVDFIKIDVEGNELNVLKGAINTIISCRPLIQLEINHCSQSYFGISPDVILSFMNEIGYSIYARCGNNYIFIHDIKKGPLNSLDEKIIYCFWTGINPMTPNRIKNLELMKSITECNVKLITPAELQSYILPEHPLHEAYQYLSETHKADYLRTYFMNFYGGGYMDIKRPLGAWSNAFKDMIDQPDKYINGYPELGPDSIGHPSAVPLWNKLVGNCAYICRPHTPLTEKWYTEMLRLLDGKLPALRLNPAKNPQDCAESKTGYPIEWNEMLGRIFHRICAEYVDNIIQTVPLINSNFYEYR